MFDTILVATQNKGKQKEFTQMLNQLDVDAVFPNDFSELEKLDVAETGTTFNENAALKAKAFSQKVDMVAVADDSGLEVDALNGAPGVYSKRYAPGSDEDRNKKLLSELADTDAKDRTARFVTVLCLHDPQKSETHFFRGEVEGIITNQPRGEDGFGYDPVFQPTGFEKTFAEMNTQQKNELSHRGRALAKLENYLEDLA